jgi:hypothetical protein
MAEPCYETVTDIGEDDEELIKKANAMVSKCVLFCSNHSC